MWAFNLTSKLIFWIIRSTVLSLLFKLAASSLGNGFDNATREIIVIYLLKNSQSPRANHQKIERHSWPPESGSCCPLQKKLNKPHRFRIIPQKRSTTVSLESFTVNLTLLIKPTLNLTALADRSVWFSRKFSNTCNSVSAWNYALAAATNVETIGEKWRYKVRASPTVALLITDRSVRTLKLHKHY